MNNLSLRGTIDMVLQEKGLAELETRLGRIEKQSRRSAKGFEAMSKATKQFGGMIAGVFAGGAIAAFARASVGEFAKIERSINVTRSLLKQFGEDAETVLPEIVDHLRQLAISGGAALEDSLPAFQKFLGVTEDSRKALALTMVASNAAETGTVKHSEAVEALASLLQGEAAEAAKRFDIDLTRANGTTKSAGEVLLEYADRVEKMAASANDAQTSQAKLSERWKSVKRDVGESLAPALTWAVDLFDWLTKAVKTVGAATGAWIDQWMVSMGALGRVVKRVFDFDALTSSPSGWMAGIKEEVARGQKHIATSGEVFKERYAEIWRETGEEAGASLADALRAAAKEADEKEDAIKAEKARLLAEQRLKAETAAQLKLMQERARLAEKGSRERLELELALLDQQLEAELANTETTEAGKQAIRERYRLKREQLIEDQAQKELEALEKHLENLEKASAERLELEQEDKRAVRELELVELEGHLSRVRDLGIWAQEEELRRLREASDQETELKLEKLEEWYETEREKREEKNADLEALDEAYQRRLTAIEKEGAEIRNEIDEWETRAKVERLFYFANVAGQVAQGFFGQSKTLSIALALINTAEAITNALATKPFLPVGLSMAALAASQGYAAVKRIRDTKLEGGGFDDPRNDQAAFRGGYRWADDMVGLFANGAASRALDAGWAQGMIRGGGSVTNHSSTSGDSYHFHGTVIDDRSIRLFMRKANRAARNDERARTLR